MRFLFSFILSFVLSFSANAQIVQFSGAPISGAGLTTWSTLKIGGGGYLTGLDIAVDGTKVVRTDTYGAYRWAGSQWTQLVTMQSMPAAQAGLGKGAGVNEIRIAPSNTSRLYMNFNGQMFISNNSGDTWSLLSNYSTVSWDANNTGVKDRGPFIAVDPANADIVFAGTPSSSLRRSLNAGSTFSNMSTVASPSGGVPHFIAFDPTSAVSGGATQGIYAASNGTGVYQTTNGGTSWTLLNSAGMPTSMGRMVVDGANGNLWVIDTSSETQTPWKGQVKKFSGGVWSNASLPTDKHSITFNGSTVYVVDDVGDVTVSTNSGSSWGTDGDPNPIRVATDVPWLQNTNEGLMSAGDAAWNFLTNRLEFAQGIGYWYAAAAQIGVTTTWTSQTIGIEQLVARWAISPWVSGSKPLVTTLDRPIFRSADPNTYPSNHGVNYNNVLVNGYSTDWATSDPTFIGVIANNGGTDTSGKSTDGGVTTPWTEFVSKTPLQSGGNPGGGMAVSTASNIVWAPSNNSTNIYFTTNGGTSWSTSTTGTSDGWGNSSSLNRQIVCADRVTANKFYAYNQGPTAAGVYSSTNSGSTYTRVKTGTLSAFDNFNASLRCVPGNANHLFFTGGPIGGPTNDADQLQRSTDGGANWSNVTNVKAIKVGFGKIAPGQTYPSIYVYGFLSSVFGIFRSDDNASSWVTISNGYPMGSFDEIQTIEGDANTYGTVYIGFSGSGFAYGKLNFLLDPDNDNIPTFLNKVG